MLVALATAVALQPWTAFAGEPPPPLDCTAPGGVDAQAVAAAQRAWARHLGEESHEKSFPLDADGTVVVEMVLLPPGKYFRGDPDSAVLITLTQPLWVGKYEVTQHQYAVLTGTNPSHFRRPPPDMASHPVESVSHREATDCCAIAARNTGGGFRLLTEAEWEYAYRAGTRTKFYNGDADDRVGEIARYGADRAPAPARVGGKAPNAFGLHDMAGNVWEWVSDLWSKSYEPTQTVDPTGPPTGQGRVTRGSSWDASSNDCRAAHRSRDAETYAGSHLGFRLARAASGPPLPLDCTGPEGADPEAVAAAQRRWALHLGAACPRRSFPLDAAGEVTVEMVLVPPGRYWRGEPKAAAVVTLPVPLWVGRFEVTQAQYEAVMGINPSHFRRRGGDAATHPVEMVSHLDAVRFCAAASQASGAEYRLLREAEWEYAYRAGTRTKYYNGDADERAVEIAQCTENNFVGTAGVGSKAANAFGLHDMGGNVWEWCADAWSKAGDPARPDGVVIRVTRGAAWDSYGRTCSATARGGSVESYAGSQLGFRVARVADDLRQEAVRPAPPAPPRSSSPAPDGS